ncbi:unnamed protein product, partial [Protopolystoma xenopodis]
VKCRRRQLTKPLQPEKRPLKVEPPQSFKAVSLRDPDQFRLRVSLALKIRFKQIEAASPSHSSHSTLPFVLVIRSQKLTAQPARPVWPHFASSHCRISAESSGLMS